MKRLRRWFRRRPTSGGHARRVDALAPRARLAQDWGNTYTIRAQDCVWIGGDFIGAYVDEAGTTLIVLSDPED